MQLLIDIDGVLKNGNDIFQGTEAFLKKIDASKKVKACLLSNSTVFDGATALDFFQNGIGRIYNIQAITAIDVAVSYAQKFGSFQFIGNEDAQKYFSQSTMESPEALIIGDLGRDWNATIMNEIFTKVMNGSELVALQLNKYGIKNDTLQLDAGAYINAISFATDKVPTLLGKPSFNFYNSAIEKVKSVKGPLYMIGDDLIGDIEGGQKTGAKACLMMTGKTNEDLLKRSHVIPDLVMNNLDELSEYFDKNQLW
jgi:HAD superfamily hydrolase (TIGR01450 family)